MEADFRRSTVSSQKSSRPSWMRPSENWSAAHATGGVDDEDGVGTLAEQRPEDRGLRLRIRSSHRQSPSPFVLPRPSFPQSFRSAPPGSWGRSPATTDGKEAPTGNPDGGWKRT